MIATSHALTGAAIGSVVKKPFLAIPLAFISHFMIDALPHFGINMTFGSTAMVWWLILDGLALCAVALFLKKRVQSPLFLAICAFAAMAPDFAWLLYGILGNELAFDPLTQFHGMIQWHESISGIFVDVLWITLMAGIILRYNHEDNQDTAAN